ncbi:hypothetical protein PCASD_04806 [Puccinia coronata f. sp. avenae]|uniref:F-box domain-containing protein n=1 Tax=Puccinia coronata f. sp. avenae TaxID=200324 RepID=A0A2N5V760_9BASI|nr:hypothetical protein PCASD_04806 [Puccinia coronata f. sp. avenae]
MWSMDLYPIPQQNIATPLHIYLTSSRALGWPSRFRVRTRCSPSPTNCPPRSPSAVVVGLQPTATIIITNSCPTTRPPPEQDSRMAPAPPDELIQAILLLIAHSFPVPLATVTLAKCCLISRQWYRLTTPILYNSPMINMGSKRRAISFLDRLVGELLEYELERMQSVKRVPKTCSLMDQMKRLMFFGEGRWRHRASFDSRPDVVDRSTLHDILNRLWCTQIEALVFVELPFTNPLHRPLVNRYPTTLTTLILLTPLSHFELLFVLRDLPTLLHLCIGSHDDTTTIPAEHHTLFSREQLPSSNLRSFGISARTLEAWLRTGMPWYQSILNLLVVPSVQSITTLHLELADEDDERHLLAILGRPLSTMSTSPISTGNEAAKVERLFKLQTVFLRGLSSVLMAESLSRLQGIRKLCLSSIYGTALRCHQSTTPEQQTESLTLPGEPNPMDPAVLLGRLPPRPSRRNLSSRTSSGSPSQAASSSSLSTSPGCPIMGPGTANLQTNSPALSPPSSPPSSVPTSLPSLPPRRPRLRVRHPWPLSPRTPTQRLDPRR